MKRVQACLCRTSTITAIMAFLMVSAGIGVIAESAEPMSTRGIIDRLKPSSAGEGRGAPRLRGITIVPPDATPKPSKVDGKRPADSATPARPDAAPDVAPDVAKPLPDIARPLVPPSIHFAINFALNSTAFDAHAVEVLSELGEALRHAELRPYKFEIAGHTDAAGSSGYNQRLSERRARAVRRYLTRTFGIEARRLRAIGYGESRLLDRAKPKSGVNRRVQITNVGRI
jgi:outer membrane protein OmpA-like peptidoglycan-associated protein